MTDLQMFLIRESINQCILYTFIISIHFSEVSKNNPLKDNYIEQWYINCQSNGYFGFFISNIQIGKGKKGKSLSKIIMTIVI